MSKYLVFQALFLIFQAVLTHGYVSECIGECIPSKLFLDKNIFAKFWEKTLFL